MDALICEYTDEMNIVCQSCFKLLGVELAGSFGRPSEQCTRRFYTPDSEMAAILIFFCLLSN